MKKDKIHFTGQHMDSYNATWNAIWSCRESGKTTFWVIKSYKRWLKEKATSIVLRYMISDITDTYILDLQTVLSDFDYDVKFKFKRGSIKDGIVDIFVDGADTDIPLFRFIAISNPISRIKSMKLKNCCQIIWDEFILNTRAGEKYPASLITRFKEIYNTYLRCCHTGKKFKLYCFGNPYSKYHPILSDLNVPFAHIKEGQFYYNAEADVYVEAYKIKDELKQFILARNPLYKFDNAYTDYAFNAEAINDSNFTILEKQPEHYILKYIFRIQNKYLKIYRCNVDRADRYFDTGRYWIDCSDKYIGSRDIFAVDLNNLVDGTELITTEMKAIFWRLKNSIAQRDVAYSSIETGYLVEALYPIL